MKEEIVLTEPMKGKANEFVLKMFPILNREIDIERSVYEFIGYEDYNEFRNVRDSLIWNNLIILRHGRNPEFYSLMPKGVEYIKQENKDWKDNDI
ncbi:hypothetical protein JCM19274_4792 [Algibacter lectus]|uniref:Uncharacterized protein n=1 Tax=Algibacter lectus TaxID=221126 RepID=A0A090WPY6_9FLAO|nr:hypothetical protein [Algibacter lectus]GAL78293.1 hypothetical protein JCM19274_4792 [Algibacter lectus]